MKLEAALTWFPGPSPPLGGIAFAKILAFGILLSPFVASVPEPNVVVSKLLQEGKCSMKGFLKRCFSLMTLATAIFQYMAILHHGWLKSSALWARPSLTLDNFPINYDQKHKHCPKGN